MAARVSARFPSFRCFADDENGRVPRTYDARPSPRLLDRIVRCLRHFLSPRSHTNERPPRSCLDDKKKEEKEEEEGGAENMRLIGGRFLCAKL